MAKMTLSLSVDEATLERARRYVERHGISLSEFVNEIFVRLPLDDDVDVADLPPITRRLYGIAAGAPDAGDYHRHLLEKYAR